MPKLLPHVDVPDTGLSHGRLNITLRVSGLGMFSANMNAAARWRQPEEVATATHRAGSAEDPIIR